MEKILWILSQRRFYAALGPTLVVFFGDEIAEAWGRAVENWALAASSALSLWSLMRPKFEAMPVVLLAVALSLSIGACSMLTSKPTSTDQLLTIDGMYMTGYVGCTMVRDRAPNRVAELQAVVNAGRMILRSDPTRDDITAMVESFRGTDERYQFPFLTMPLWLLYQTAAANGVADYDATYHAAASSFIEGCGVGLTPLAG